MDGNFIELGGVFQPVEEALMIFGIAENGLPVNRKLNHVMRLGGDDESRLAGHGTDFLHSCEEVVIIPFE
jgi:hypothetical protein